MSKKVLTTTEINKMIRQEGLCGNNRLPSFGLPRDLSLGGTKAKRNYTPNFNAVRSKDKNNPLVGKNGLSTQKPNNRAPKRSFGGSRNNKQGKYVETEGIFSEGMGKAPSFPRSSYSVKSSSAKDRQNIDALVLPKISSTDFMIKDEDDFEPSRSFKYDNDDNFHASDIFQALRVVDPVTYEFNANEKPLLKVKKEEYNDALCDTHINKKIRTDFKQEETSTKMMGYSAFTTATNTLSDDKPAFSLFKFPDSLLGFPGGDNETHSNLGNLPEGQFGKLIIRKSGKMEMNINNIRYTVTQDKMHGHHQAMLFPGEQSMSTDALVTLGTLTEKYTVTPNWKELFQKPDSLDAQ